MLKFTLKKLMIFTKFKIFIQLIPLEVNLAWSSSWSILSHDSLLTGDPFVNNC